jgi:hypothetical protein
VASFPRAWSPDFTSSATTRGRTPASPEPAQDRRNTWLGRSVSTRGGSSTLTHACSLVGAGVDVPTIADPVLARIHTLVRRKGQDTRAWTGGGGGV